MKKLISLAASILCCSFLFAEGTVLDDATVANENVEKVDSITSVSASGGVRLFVVGDSTLSAFNDNYYYPRYGYGTKLAEYLDSSKITVENLAMSGRSSKSFLKEKNYKTFVDNIKEGDYLVIGFGHNDEKAEASRYADPNGSKDDEGSFKNVLYENYVKVALERKAVPVLCTPIVRRSKDGTYSGSTIHITADKDGFRGGDYSKAILELGEELGVSVVDLTSITKERYQKLSPAKTAKFHAQKTKDDDSVDNTHLNVYGATMVAYDVVSELKKKDSVFASYVLPGIKPPVEKKVLVKNKNYKKR